MAHRRGAAITALSDHVVTALGLVDSIPVGRAVALGASTVYVLHVGRIERPLTVPRRPWEVGLVAFEIARRHRFHEEMLALPQEVRAHVLPAGADRRRSDLSQLRHRDKTRVGASITPADRAISEPPLRDHALVPGSDLPDGD